MGLHLFEIPDKYREALNDPEVLDQGTGELYQPEVLEKLDTEKERIVLYLAKFAREQLAEAEAVKAQADRLKARAARHVAKAESLKRYMAGSCELGEKFADDTLQVRIGESTSVDVLEERDIPGTFFATPDPPKPKLDRAWVLRELRAGNAVKGAALKRTPFAVIS